MVQLQDIISIAFHASTATNIYIYIYWCIKMTNAFNIMYTCDE